MNEVQVVIDIILCEHELIASLKQMSTCGMEVQSEKIHKTSLDHRE